jgi:starch synthase
MPFALSAADDLEGKRIVKHYVQKGLGLETDLQLEPSSPSGFSKKVTRQPLVVCVTRLVAQKGVHLIR